MGRQQTATIDRRHSTIRDLGAQFASFKIYPHSDVEDEVLPLSNG